MKINLIRIYLQPLIVSFLSVVIPGTRHSDREEQLRTQPSQR